MCFLTEQHSNNHKSLKIKEKVAILSDLPNLAERRGLEPLHGFNTVAD